MQRGSEESKRAAANFLEKIEKTVLLTKQKAQNAINSVVGETKPAAQPSSHPVEDFEERQLQWALQEGSRTASANASSEGASGIAPEAVELQTAAARVSQCLQDAETRAAVAEEETVKLRAELKENQLVADALSEQLRIMESQLEASALQCRELQSTFTSDEEHESTVSQLLAHIAKLETELLNATHFASEDVTTQETPAEEAADRAVEGVIEGGSTNEGDGHRAGPDPEGEPEPDVARKGDVPETVAEPAMTGPGDASPAALDKVHISLEEADPQAPSEQTSS